MDLDFDDDDDQDLPLECYLDAVPGSPPLLVPADGMYEFGTLAAPLAKAFTDWLQATISERPLQVSMPIAWRDSTGLGEPRPRDALTIHVGLPYTHETEFYTYFSTTLRDIVQAGVSELIHLQSEEVDHDEGPPTRRLDPDSIAILEEIAGGLRIILADVTEAIEAAKSEAAAENSPTPEPRTEGEHAMTPEQIKHMVQRFLMWRLPYTFSPDCGISFTGKFANGEPFPMSHWPVGTNLLDATQAEAMVRHMLDGLPQEFPHEGARR